MGLIPLTRRFLSAAVMLALAACGDPGAVSVHKPASPLTDPVVAATVNGKPIYVDDVVAEAVSRGAIKEGEDLDPNSPLFYQITEDLIETRLFAIEAEARGLDKDPDVRHRLDIARERILANVLNENIANTALKDASIERMYREQVKLLKQGQQVRISDILLESKEDAVAAKRRLDQGESFVSLAYELSKDRVSGPEGGEVGWRSLEALPDAIKTAVTGTDVGKVAGPVKTEDGWHLIKVDEKRDETPPSLESMRPQIVQWLMFDEQRRVVEKLKSAARIARLNETPPAGVAARPGMPMPQDRPQSGGPQSVAPQAGGPLSSGPLGNGAPGLDSGLRLGPGGQAADAGGASSAAPPSPRPSPSGAKPAPLSAAKPKPPASGAPPVSGDRDL